MIVDKTDWFVILCLYESAVIVSQTTQITIESMNSYHRYLYFDLISRKAI